MENSGHFLALFRQSKKHTYFFLLFFWTHPNQTIQLPRLQGNLFISSAIVVSDLTIMAALRVWMIAGLLTCIDLYVYVKLSLDFMKFKEAGPFMQVVHSESRGSYVQFFQGKRTLVWLNMWLKLTLSASPAAVMGQNKLTLAKQLQSKALLLRLTDLQKSCLSLRKYTRNEICSLLSSLMMWKVLPWQCNEKEKCSSIDKDSDCHVWRSGVT